MRTEILSMHNRRTHPIPALALAAALILAGLALEPAPVAAAATADTGDLLAALAPHQPPAAIAVAYGPESLQPLGTPAPLKIASSSYAFVNTSPDGSPVAYDPCRPIHYVTREANAPTEGGQLVREAVAAVSTATGLVFINDGTTTEAPAAKHSSYQPGRYGNRPAPVLIAWETPAEEPAFTLAARGIVLGITGSEGFQTPDGRFTYISGQVALNGPGLGLMLKKAGLDAARGLIEHELGHLVGLEHVSDPTQLMNPSMTTGVTDYQPGDLTGLAILGQGNASRDSDRGSPLPDGPVRSVTNDLEGDKVLGAGGGRVCLQLPDLDVDPAGRIPDAHPRLRRPPGHTLKPAHRLCPYQPDLPLEGKVERYTLFRIRHFDALHAGVLSPIYGCRFLSA